MFCALLKDVEKNTIMKKTSKIIATKSIISIAFVLVFLNIFTGLSLAAMPAYSNLQPITANLTSPSAVAVDGNENVYVVDSKFGRLMIYGRDGRYLGSLLGIGQPGSVALDGGGNIYVGNMDANSVDVYRQNLTLSHRLGSGNGEFGEPGAIAVSASGIVYVADVLENVIKSYNSDGSYRSSFGSNFNKPSGIAINETAGEMIISDLQIIQDSNGTYAGARVQIFDMNGIQKRSFGEYGQGEGKMLRPKGVATDNQGRIYVTDAAQNVVQVFDGAGVYLGTIYDLNNPMRTPLGIALGVSGRLFIASLMGPRIDVVGIENYSQLSVSPLSLSFEGQENGLNPVPQNISITNSGGSAVNWTASSNDGWISLSSLSGTAEPGTTSLINVSVNSAGLAAGSYAGSVEVTSAETGITDVVDVAFTVLPSAPVLQVTPASLEFLSEQGAIPSAQAININNAGGGVLDWTASTDSLWIILSKSAGTAPDSINVSVDISALAEGIHAGSIAVTGAGTTVIIPVTLGVFIYEGTINVTTNLTDAAFRINGPASYTGSGTSWSVSGAPAGTYVIIYGDVVGYVTPPSETLTLQDSGTISFSGVYAVEAPPAVNRGNIIVGAGPGSANTALVRIYSYDGSQKLAEFTANNYKFGVNVATGDLDGDGQYEIITGAGPGSTNPADVGVFDSTGAKITGVTPFSWKFGVNVAAGDLDGDGNDEVIAGAGPSVDARTRVKVYVYKSTTATLVFSGVEMDAYGTSVYGTRVAAADIDGDGKAEIITAPGAAAGKTGKIRIWKVNQNKGIGYWTASLYKEFTAVYPNDYSVSIAGGDINGDGIDEVITGAGPNKSAVDTIKVYNADGVLMTEFASGASFSGYGVNVAGGDIDGDGIADIIAGAGPGSLNVGKVKVFDAYGAEKGSFTGLDTKFGANVAAGVIGN
jgi:hypothetical protein